MWMAPVVYLLGKLAFRHVRWQIEARHALLTGGESPEPVVNPFLEDGLANKIMMAAFATACPPTGQGLPGAPVSSPETPAEGPA